MSLDFSRLRGYTVLAARVLEPSTRPEDFGILTPDSLRTIHGLHRYRDEGSFGDRQAIYEFS